MAADKRTIVTSVDSLVASLMATEDIKVVVSPSASTAYFDLVGRTLTLPNWKYNSQIKSFLIAHEVSHALHTNSDRYIATIKENPKIQNILNVIEDVRVDILIQKKFPGVVSDFRTGYDALVEQGLFPSKIDPNWTFIDKANFYFKSQRRKLVAFNAKESILIDRIANCETIEDVIAIAKEIAEAIEKKELSKPFIPEKEEEEEEEEEDENLSESDVPFDDDEDSDDDSDEDFDDEDDDFDGDESLEKDDFENNIKTPSTLEKDEYSSEVTESTNKVFNGEACEGFLDCVLDKEIGKDNIIINAIEKCTFIEKELGVDFEPLGRTVCLKFSKEVSYMSQVFNMKKAARAYLYTSQNVTGRINTDRLVHYKTSEDIFLSKEEHHNEKNHGFVFAIDFSSSMNGNNIWLSIIELIKFTQFCQKNDIPYVVYAYTSGMKLASLYDIAQTIVEKSYTTYIPDSDSTKFTKLFSSDMKIRDYYKIVGALIESNFIKTRSSYTKNSFNNLPFIASKLGMRFISNDELSRVGIYGERRDSIMEAFNCFSPSGSTPTTQMLLALPRLMNLNSHLFSNVHKKHFINLTDGEENRCEISINEMENGYVKSSHYPLNVKDELTGKSYFCPSLSNHYLTNPDQAAHNHILSKVAIDRARTYCGFESMTLVYVSEDRKNKLNVAIRCILYSKMPIGTSRYASYPGSVTDQMVLSKELKNQSNGSFIKIEKNNKDVLEMNHSWSYDGYYFLSLGDIERDQQLAQEAWSDCNNDSSVKEIKRALLKRVSAEIYAKKLINSWIEMVS